MSSKLSTSVSAHDLRNISSYREQRLVAKPPSTTDLGQHSNSCWTARNDLESIQECLRNSLYKRRESYGEKDSHLQRHEPLDAVLGRLNREIEGISSPKASDFTIEEVNRYKVLNKYVLAENSLNTIEENPHPSLHVITSIIQNGKKDQLTMSQKFQSRPNINSNKNPLTASTTYMPKQVIQVNKGIASTPTNQCKSILAGSKQSIKKPVTRPATSYKPGVTKTEVLKFTKKVEQLKEEFGPMAFRKQQEIMGCLQQIMELMKEQ